MKKIILVVLMALKVGSAFADDDLFKCKGHVIKGLKGVTDGTVIMDTLNYRATWQSKGSDAVYVIAGANNLCDFDISNRSCRPIWKDDDWVVNISTFCSMSGNFNGATDGLLAYSKVGRNGRSLCKAIKNNRISDMEVRFHSCEPIERSAATPLPAVGK